MTAVKDSMFFFWMPSLSTFILYSVLQYGIFGVILSSTHPKIIKHNVHKMWMLSRVHFNMQFFKKNIYNIGKCINFLLSVCSYDIKFHSYLKTTSHNLGICMASQKYECTQGVSSPCSLKTLLHTPGMHAVFD